MTRKQKKSTYRGDTADLLAGGSNCIMFSCRRSAVTRGTHAPTPIDGGFLSVTSACASSETGVDEKYSPDGCPEALKCWCEGEIAGWQRGKGGLSDGLKHRRVHTVLFYLKVEHGESWSLETRPVSLRSSNRSVCATRVHRANKYFAQIPNLHQRPEGSTVSADTGLGLATHRASLSSWPASTSSHNSECVPLHEKLSPVPNVSSLRATNGHSSYTTSPCCSNTFVRFTLPVLVTCAMNGRLSLFLFRHAFSDPLLAPHNVFHQGWWADILQDEA